MEITPCSSHGDQSGLLLPYQSTSPFPGILGSYWQVPKALTPWVSTPGQYSAQCKHANGASWLQLSELPYTGPAPDPRLQIAETLGPLWGTHLVNVNIALGNLVDLTAVRRGPTKLTVTTAVQDTGGRLDRIWRLLARGHMAT